MHPSNVCVTLCLYVLVSLGKSHLKLLLKEALGCSQVAKATVGAAQTAEGPHLHGNVLDLTGQDEVLLVIVC